MPRGYAANALRDLHALFDGGTVAGLTDAQLLGRFAARRAESAGAVASAEAAFAALVDRHGPMVWGVCLDILGDAHEAEDAFQATFLVLTRRAGSVRVGDSLGRWLHGVARRVALRARAQARRREAFRVTGAVQTAAEAERAAILGDLCAAVGEEVGRLPARYRAAVELCHLRGLTNEEAARELGWPVGTVKSRLARGRERLRLRLSRRGLAPAASGTAGASSGTARAAVPPALARSTVRAVALLSAAGGPGAFPAPVAALAAGAMRAMILKKLVLSAAAAAGMVATGAGVYAFQEPVVPNQPAGPEALPPLTAGGAAVDPPKAALAPVPAPVVPLAGPLVEDLARRARELQDQNRFAEALGVVRQLGNVVDDWEAKLGTMVGLTGSVAPTTTSRSDPWKELYRVHRPDAPNVPYRVYGPEPSVAPAPAASGDPGPVASDQEQRIRRLEQLLNRLLKEREGEERRNDAARDRARPNTGQPGMQTK